MKEPVFIDTGFWIALFDGRDNYHKTAKTLYSSLFRSYRPVISDFILFETITYLNCSLKRHDLAIHFLDRLSRSRLEMITVEEKIKTEALKIFRQYSDKLFSITDCTSFTAMVQNSIRYFAGFDEHFKHMGFIDIQDHS